MKLTVSNLSQAYFQVTEEVKKILEQEGFEFECRGLINVKGKGEMTTYFLKIPEDELEPELGISEKS